MTNMQTEEVILDNHKEPTPRRWNDTVQGIKPLSEMTPDEAYMLGFREGHHFALRSTEG